MSKKSIFTAIAVIAISSIMFYSMNKPESENFGQAEAFVSNTPYPDFLDSIQVKKKSLNVEKARQYLFEIFNDYIPLYWTGTKWDFNGVTREPKNGAIACGYFVTNTLSDIGLEISRIKLAQAASSEMINKLCVNIKYFSNFDKMKAHLLQKPDNNLYIVGLDFHTGYLLKTEGEIYFLHSNYIQKSGVMKEVAGNSLALTSSKSFMIGSLTENDDLIQKWMKD